MRVLSRYRTRSRCQFEHHGFTMAGRNASRPFARGSGQRPAVLRQCLHHMRWRLSSVPGLAGRASHAWALCATPCPSGVPRARSEQEADLRAARCGYAEYPIPCPADLTSAGGVGPVLVAVYRGSWRHSDVRATGRGRWAHGAGARGWCDLTFMLHLGCMDLGIDAAHLVV